MYDVTRFKGLHPGGASVFLDDEVGAFSDTVFPLYDPGRLLYCLFLCTAGQDATDAFYGLHRHEIILRPQYARLQIGVIEGQKSVITGTVTGELSKVPYAEPTWLANGYFSPYFKQVLTILALLNEIMTGSLLLISQSHWALQKAMRKLTDEVITPDAQVRKFQYL